MTGFCHISAKTVKRVLSDAVIHCAAMCVSGHAVNPVTRIHDVLKWANRTAVAEEVTRRGYRVSPETLNRWVRQDKEVPAIVERIVFELFGIGAHDERPPAWAEGLVDDAIARTVRLLGGPEYPAALELLRERLEGIPPPPHEAGDAEGEAPGPGTSAPQVRRVG